MGAYLAQVDWALRSGQNLYPPSLGPVGIATDLPPTPPPPPGTSATADGAAGAAGERDKQLRTAAGVDAAATSAAKSGAGEAQAGRAGAAGVRSTAAAQAAAIAPATGHPAGVRALVSAMDDKLAAMQRQLSTTQAQNRLLAARMRQLAQAYRAAGRTGGGGPPARWAGSSGLSGLSGVSTLASGVSGLASAPSAAVSSLTAPATSLIGSAARPLRQFTSPGRGASSSLMRNAPVGALLPGVANERGLQRNTILAARAISAAFPEIREIGGYRRDRLHWHPNGLAIDVMIPDYNTPAGRALGDRVLQFVMTHGERFGLDNAIWRQTLYEENGSASRMGNLGNPTANHFDHVHIATTGGGFPRGRQMYAL